ncbi:beta-galactosidase [Devosia yakushimensis]|uniref:Beta-galactosidase n=1 Tax=Devosia yakushimensis TaxID=470028 RepID=A0ABQ5UKH3_9HYPH|nr:glycoside hydrolase family 2 TIM barrel-domain containing protein [Devosia yakushimensis]GLQ12134.1 beta-galactosidase [Devosia yakushimensis]
MTTGLPLADIEDNSGTTTATWCDPSDTIRPIQPLTGGWRFRQDDELIGAEDPDFNDKGWQMVSVPHSWNRVGYYVSEQQIEHAPPSHINLHQGVGWYRLSFVPDAAFGNKKAWLQFDAASRSATVWLNGVLLGHHAGGFSRFRFDASAVLRIKEPNILVVKVDNSAPRAGHPNGDILPLAGDFFVHGGLYRPVCLVGTSSVHLEMLDFGSSGIYAETRSVHHGAATIAVRSLLRNSTSNSVSVVVTTQLVDAEGNIAAKQSRLASMHAGDGCALEHELTIAQARLWQGISDPYLYRLIVECCTEEGEVLDLVAQQFGVRQVGFDPERGFILNGSPHRLKGISLHQDRAGKGWAVNAADIAADIDMILEAGANSIRLGHYQHGSTIHQLADRHGLILWAEIPLVTIWMLGETQQEASSELMNNARQQLRELIRQNYNHASIVTWGIANEVDFGSVLPGMFKGNRGASDPTAMLEELSALAQAEDPTRPTTQANACEGRFPNDDGIPIVAPTTDLVGLNRYFGWYYGAISDLGPHLDAIRQRRPWQPLAVSEYGGGGAVTIHSDNPLGGPPDSRGRLQPEEYMTYVHEATWAVLASKAYLWGSWVWSGFDFATTVRREGDADDLNTKGLVTYDRKIRKDAFFFYKANWSSAPTVHITGRRYVDRAYRVNDLRVYSNADRTSLTVNGRPLGMRAVGALKTCVWEAVELDIGDNVIVATGHFPDGPREDRIVLEVSGRTATEVRIDCGALVAAAAQSGRFGSDSFFDGGRAGTTTKPADYGRARVTAPIANTADPEVAATFREGHFRYSIPVSEGRHEITLTFLEPLAGRGERRFDVLVNGKLALESIDIAAEANGKMVVVKRTVSATARNGKLDLHFRPLQGDAIVNAIEVVRC